MMQFVADGVPDKIKWKLFRPSYVLLHYRLIHRIHSIRRMAGDKPIPVTCFTGFLGKLFIPSCTEYSLPSQVPYVLVLTDQT
jgi:hypothetical protein